MLVTLADRAVTSPPLPLITAREARAASLDVASPPYVRIRRGVYADAGDVAGLSPWERYAARVHAFALTHPDAILCLESAAVVHGLPRFGETRDIHVYDPFRLSSTRFGDVAVHTSLDVRDVEVVHGNPVTSLHDTVVDLARAVPPAQALAVVDASISPAQGGAKTRQELRSVLDRHVSSRGRRRAEWAIDCADPDAESVGESVSRAVIHWCGFEVPEIQRAFAYEGHADRVDFYFPSSRTVGESDGWGKYDLPDPAAAERHLRREKLREDRLRRHGHPFARWDLTDALRVEPLRRALLAASVRIVRPPDRGALATLRFSPRSV